MRVFDSCLERITPGEVLDALDKASAQVRRNLPQFTHRSMNHSSVNGFYPACRNDQWTAGFWPGQIWLAFEHTGDPQFREAALVHVDSFMQRIRRRIEIDHHDMGFLYSPSCVAAWKLDRSATGRDAALLAARHLSTRFQEKGRFIQAWGKPGIRENYRFIIDCLMNLPLLYWAHRTTGETRFRDIAELHTATCRTYSVRPDWSTHHTFFMDPETGEGDHGETCQGYRDDSSWTRGQAWGIYGFALAYRYTGIADYADVFRNLSAYYLRRLPSDLVPFWDLIFTHGEPRDSSSAAIVACAFLEMSERLGDDEAEYYRTLAGQMVKSLADGYSVKDPSLSNGLLLHGTYSKKSPYNTCREEGVDECLSWGDYFYMEALTRLSKDWVSYW